MPADSNTLTICGCVVPQYSSIISDTVDFQNGANNVYESKKNLVSAAQNGTLGSAANGQPTFKSDYERMQYLLGKQNRASCGVPRRAFALGTA